MRIHPDALERIRTAPFSGDAVVAEFERLFEAFQNIGNTGCPLSICFDYENVNDTQQEGDLYPVLTLTLRPCSKQSPSGSASS